MLCMVAGRISVSLGFELIVEKVTIDTKLLRWLLRTRKATTRNTYKKIKSKTYF